MGHDTNDHGARGCRRKTRRRLAACLAPASVLLVAGAFASSSSGAALVPLPTTTTTAPTRPTTPLPTRPTIEPPRDTTTTSTTTTPSLPTTAPSTENPTTTIAGPIPEPPTNPPISTTQPATEPATSEPETAPFVMSNPVVIDPEDPTVQPPVIVSVAPYCSGGFGYAKVVVQNVDLFHYPAPFAAVFEWSLADASTTVEGDSFPILGWESQMIELGLGGAHDPGSYTITVSDVDLGVSATADVAIPDCTNPPAPLPDPLPPLVVVAAVECAEDWGQDTGSGGFTFFVNNQPGDEVAPREYDFDVLRTASQLSVDSGSLGNVGQTHWTSHAVESEPAGTYIVTVTDHDDGALTASVSVEVPPCAPDAPPGEPVAPVLPLQFIQVTTHCADPALLDGRADYVILDPNYQFLGGPAGEIAIDWTLSSGAVVLEATSGSSFQAPGVHDTFSDQLAPGEYTATISVTNFPALTDSVTYTIDECSNNPGFPPDLLAVYGVTRLCIPGDETETVLFVVDHYFNPNVLGWKIVDGQNTLAGFPEIHLDGDTGNAFSARHLPVGSYQLIVTSVNHPSTSVATPIEIASCVDQPASGEPSDPSDPDDPSEPSEPSDSSEPAVPQPTDPGDSTLPSTSAAPAGPGTESGTLPATR